MSCAYKKKCMVRLKTHLRTFLNSYKKNECNRTFSPCYYLKDGCGNKASKAFILRNKYHCRFLKTLFLKHSTGSKSEAYKNLCKNTHIHTKIQEDNFKNPNESDFLC